MVPLAGAPRGCDSTFLLPLIEEEQLQARGRLVPAKCCGVQSKETLPGAVPDGFSTNPSQLLKDDVDQVCCSHALQLDPALGRGRARAVPLFPF